MVQQVGLDLGTSLIYTGLFNIIVGLLFDVPLPTQPMKMIVTIAISSAAVGLPESLAAGMFVGACSLVLGITGLIIVINRIVPPSVVKGMQLAIGLELAYKGLAMVYYDNGKSGTIRTWWGPDSIAVGIAVGLFILFTVYGPQLHAIRYPQYTVLPHGASVGLPAKPSPVLPAAIVLVLAGICVTCWLHPEVIKALSLGPTIPQFRMPTQDQWKTGILMAGLPQLPLTTLNSIIAVERYAQERFPNRPVPANRLASVLGLVNVCGGWFGALPSCNGVGGLAAQTAFGAESGVACVVLGVVKIVLGLAFGSSLLELFHRFPASILGAMLVFAGVELAACCVGVQPGPDTVIMLLTTVLCSFTKHVGIGVVGGMGCYVVLELGGWTLSWYDSRWRVTQVQGQGAYQGMQQERLVIAA